MKFGFVLGRIKKPARGKFWNTPSALEKQRATTAMKTAEVTRETKRAKRVKGIMGIAKKRSPTLRANRG